MKPVFQNILLLVVGVTITLSACRREPVNCPRLVDLNSALELSGDNRGQKIHAAKEFLQEVLASGSVAQTKVAEEAESRGIKKKTLWNAKKELEIDSVKIGNQWFWMLPE